MFQELLPLLPKEAGTLALILAMAGALVGAGLWLIGAKFSRSLITLVLVSVGGGTGLFLPQWLGWNFDGWAPAILLALVLGASGLILHRFWVGMGLGLVLAGWAAVAVWTIFKGQGTWSIPKVETGMSAIAYGKVLWEGFPLEMRRVLPVACGAVGIGGVAAAMLWPRICIVILYSMLGVSMLVGMGLCSMNAARPQWLGALPNRSSSQLLAMLGMVAFGALLQWKIALSKQGMNPTLSRPLVVQD
jgi:hypothetical protein